MTYDLPRPDPLPEGAVSQQPLKLALIRGRYVEDGGAERFVARALTALHGTDLQITVFARDWPATGPFTVEYCRPFHLGRVWRDRAFARCVCARLQRGGFDLVQSHERIACCNIYRAGDGVHREWLAQRARVLGPVQRQLLQLNPYHRYLLRAEAALFASPRLRAVICNSQMVRDEIQRHYGVAPDKLHVIYSGVDTEHFHPRLKSERDTVCARHSVPSDATVFLFVGSGFERKGLAATLAALARVPGAYLLIVGRDKHASRYATQAHVLGIADRVRFLGRQSDVRPYYGAADALVLPSLYDPFPNVALEAMACGLPLITSTKSGAAELVREGENGFVADALDSTAIVDAMRRLTVTATAVRLGAAARRTVEPLTLERMGARLRALYQSLLAPAS